MNLNPEGILCILVVPYKVGRERGSLFLMFDDCVMSDKICGDDLVKQAKVPESIIS